MINRIKLAIISDTSYNTRYVFLEVDNDTTDEDVDKTIREAINKAKPKEGTVDYKAVLAKAGVGVIPNSNVVSMEYGVNANFSAGAMRVADAIKDSPLFLRTQVADNNLIALAMLRDNSWKESQEIDLLDRTPFLTIVPM
jgi:hypothetical protein